MLASLVSIGWAQETLDVSVTVSVYQSRLTLLKRRRSLHVNRLIDVITKCNRVVATGQPIRNLFCSHCKVFENDSFWNSGWRSYDGSRISVLIDVCLIGNDHVWRSGVASVHRFPLVRPDSYIKEPRVGHFHTKKAPTYGAIFKKKIDCQLQVCASGQVLTNSLVTLHVANLCLSLCLYVYRRSSRSVERILAVNLPLLIAN